jgi:argininosuccinate lyase
VTPGDEYSTGSSIMPQKKNPDSWELIRGKTARATSALSGLFTTLKGLPTGYQRDLQEDKELLFAAHDQTLAVLRVAAGAVSTMRVNDERLRRAAADPGLLATEAADFLVRRGLPFRQAHEVVGKIVREAERLGADWTAFSLDQLRHFSPLFNDTLGPALTLESALNSRSAAGGTSAKNVRASIDHYRERLRRLEVN